MTTIQPRSVHRGALVTPQLHACSHVFDPPPWLPHAPHVRQGHHTPAPPQGGQCDMCVGLCVRADQVRTQAHTHTLSLSLTSQLILPSAQPNPHAHIRTRTHAHTRTYAHTRIHRSNDILCQGIDPQHRINENIPSQTHIEFNASTPNG